jgi:hypothetical protein
MGLAFNPLWMPKFPISINQNHSRDKPKGPWHLRFGAAAQYGQKRSSSGAAAKFGSSSI